MKISPLLLLHKFSTALMLTLKPFGIWGLGALALIDASLIPIPVSMDGVLIGYVATNHSKAFLYVLMASFASAVGSLVPYYIGRAGGEIFLLKRINRERYERMRDRFEKQEFLAIMIPAMMPPPMPIKLFEFAAGVFEMKPLPFATAIFVGKFIQFMVCAIITVVYGPAIVHNARHMIHDHSGAAIGLVLAAVVFIAVWVTRKIFDRRRGVRFPVEEIDEGQ